MNEAEQALYDRISQFSFDEGNEELRFARRLARENGWTPSYTARVIDEYRRFIFLAVAADHPVTPSDQVDQVWHLHLTYTHSYWDRFCGQILGTALHHGPTRGGPEEARKFHRWYENTRKSYRRFFCQDPPPDIWPDASIRFGDDLCFRRVNTKRNWVIAKLRLKRTTGKIIVLALLVLVLCTSAGGIKTFFSGVDHSRALTTPRVTQSLAAATPDQSHALTLAQVNPRNIILFATFILLAIIAYFAYIFGNRCPECKHGRALEMTGNWGRSDNLFNAEQEEWKCKFCGYREWRAEESDGCGCE